MRTEYTDCGSKASGLKERNDCTVRATAAALRIPYPEARQKLAALGRKPRCGFKFREPAMKALGFEAMPEFSCMTWQKVEKALPSLGAFVIRVRQHVFAVVDSVVMDSHEPKPRKAVRMVYRVKQADCGTVSGHLECASESIQTLPKLQPYQEAILAGEGNLRLGLYSKPRRADFSIYSFGTVSLFTPLTGAAQRWLNAHCPEGESHQYMGLSLAVDCRYVEDLWLRAVEDGLTVSGRAAR